MKRFTLLVAMLAFGLVGISGSVAQAAPPIHLGGHHVHVPHHVGGHHLSHHSTGYRNLGSYGPSYSLGYGSSGYLSPYTYSLPAGYVVPQGYSIPQFPQHHIPHHQQHHLW